MCSLFEVAQIVVGFLSVWLHIVGVVHFHEPLPCSLLVGLHLLAGVAPHLLVGLDVAGDAQQLDVGRIVTELLHLHDGTATLHGLDVVAVHAWRDVPVGHSCRLALADAPLTQSVGTSPHLGLHLPPPWAVQQSLVVLVSAHIFTILLHVVATEGSPDRRAFPGRPWVWVLTAPDWAVGIDFLQSFADFTDENLCRWTAFALVIDTVRPSSNVALNVIASLSKSALIKPFSLRKVFPLVVLIEIIVITY